MKHLWLINYTTLRRSRAWVWRALLVLAVAQGAAAQASVCGGAHYRDFDFWLGEWQVNKPDGSLAGHNRIVKIEGDCVLHERYQAPSGYSGQSFTLFDASRERWHQTWVDNQGALLQLDGGLRAGKMVLEGRSNTPQGEQLNRITWSREPDGRVRQLWQLQQGETWTTVFDGYYQRRARATGAD